MARSSSGVSSALSARSGSNVSKVWNTMTMRPSAMKMTKRWTGMVALGARNQVLGDAFYTLAILGGYDVIHRLNQPARQAA
jgi:hypothetical protein